MKKILKILALLLTLLGLNALDAQEMVYKDKLFLREGSIIVGAITDFQPGSKITMELKSGNVLTFYDGQIKKVKMYQGAFEKKKQVLALLPLTDKRIYYETSFAFLSGASGLGASISQNVFYQQTHRWAIGAGLGIDNFRLAPGQSTYPLFANTKFNLTNTRNSPYIGMKLGYGFAFANSQENISQASGGVMFNPYFGIRLGSRGTIFNLFAGITTQKVDYVFTRPWEKRTEDVLFRRLALGMSLMF